MTSQDLADRFGVSVNTIYWYRKIGVIPPPIGKTCNARYGKQHVVALQAYREHIPERGSRITAACIAERRQAGLLP